MHNIIFSIVRCVDCGLDNIYGSNSEKDVDESSIGVSVVVLVVAFVVLYRSFP